eukprot:tig00000663_g2951.t1
MDLLTGYGSDGEDAPAQPSTSTALSLKVNTAPTILDNDLLRDKHAADPTRSLIHYNPKVDQLWAPVAGPQHPFRADSMSKGFKNTLTGYVEKYAMNETVFDEAERAYNRANAEAYLAEQGELPASTANPLKGLSVYDTKESREEKEKANKKRKLPAGDASAVETFLGPWAPYHFEIERKEKMSNVDLSEEQKMYLDSIKKAKEEAFAEAKDSTIFHGDSEVDYQGRSWIEKPSELKDMPPDECYIPKQLVHTWVGHTKAIQRIQFFPTYGHLLLSAGMDTKIKIWDVYGSRKCMRTYMGHTKPLKDICFSHDGRKFLSCAHDKMIKLWDTETGQCIKSFTNGKVANVVRFHPDADKQTEFVVGCNDKRLYQWSTEKDIPTLEYDQHLSQVNTVTFVDDNRRFVSSSDDKTLRVWEWGIPVVIKYIAEPHMHSMPSIDLHPNGKWFLAQSLDNQILVYGARDRFKINKRKVFRGHLVSGFACQVGVSPDGRFVYSGDANGKLWFWDWKTCKVFRTIKAHEGAVCIGAAWHPLETSKVATCGWDGTIKFWD